MIDVHCHVVPDDIPFGLSGDDRWPRLERNGDHVEVMIAGKVFRRLRHHGMVDIALRIEDMDRDGVQVQVVFPLPELFSYWAKPEDGLRYCRGMNGWLAEMCASNPGRIRALGIVPMQNVELATGLLAEIKAAGLDGVAVGTNVAGKSIATRDYLPFYQEVARQDLAIFFHALHPPQIDVVPTGWIQSAVLWPVDAGFCASAMIVNRILDETPDLRMAVGHGGGGLPLTIHRLTQMWNWDEATRLALPKPPIEYFRQMYFTTETFEPEVLRSLIDLAGEDRVIVGSDYPFFNIVKIPPGWPLQDVLEPSDPVRRKIEIDNACAFLGIPELIAELRNG